MRIRQIKPQFWIDEDLGSIPRDARLTYVGLWNLADDRGVFEWRPARILIQLYPYDRDITPADIETWLNNLFKIGDIIKFEEDGKSFGFIIHFKDHQQIKKKSKWTFTKSTPLVGNQLPPSGEPVTLRKKREVVGSREKVVGSREKDDSKNHPSSSSSDNNSFVIKIYGEKIGKVTASIREKIETACKEFSPEWVTDAVTVASEKNKRTWGYISGILINFRNEGHIPDGGSHKESSEPVSDDGMEGLESI